MEESEADIKFLHLENQLLRDENVRLKLQCKHYQDTIEIILSKGDITALMEYKDVHDMMHQFIGNNVATNSLHTFRDIQYHQDIMVKFIDGLLEDGELEDELEEKFKNFLKKLQSATHF